MNKPENYPLTSTALPDDAKVPACRRRRAALAAPAGAGRGGRAGRAAGTAATGPLDDPPTTAPSCTLPAPALLAGPVGDRGPAARPAQKALLRCCGQGALHHAAACPAGAFLTHRRSPRVFASGDEPPHLALPTHLMYPLPLWRPLPQFDQAGCGCEAALGSTLKAVGLESQPQGLQGGAWSGRGRGRRRGAVGCSRGMGGARGAAGSSRGAHRAVPATPPPFHSRSPSHWLPRSRQDCQHRLQVPALPVPVSWRESTRSPRSPRASRPAARHQRPWRPPGTRPLLTIGNRPASSCTARTKRGGPGRPPCTATGLPACMWTSLDWTKNAEAQLSAGPASRGERVDLKGW